MPVFEDVYEAHVWDVYGFLAYRLNRRDDAEDLTQLTFERALRSWDRFDERRASARTWLLAIARNALVDHFRRDRSGLIRSLNEEDSAELRGLPTEPGPEETRLGPDPELHVALGRLSEREREVVALRFGAEFTGPEIAAMLDLTLANVQQISSRALRKLRTELDRDEPGTETVEPPAAYSGARRGQA
jgi:RNA polymerase sigma-70 factor (ECF subfamily)